MPTGRGAARRAAPETYRPLRRIAMYSLPLSRRVSIARRVARWLAEAMTVAALLILSGAPTASATPVTYYYTGTPYTYFLDSGQIFSTAPPISGWITMASPLSPNLSNQSITPTAYSFNITDLLALSSAIGNPCCQSVSTSFAVSTDGAANIT